MEGGYMRKFNMDLGNKLVKQKTEKSVSDGNDSFHFSFEGRRKV
jgi:hypothetical protein